MQACAEEARGQLPHINGNEGDCWDTATYMAVSAAHLLEEDVCHYQRKKASLWELKRVAGAAIKSHKVGKCYVAIIVDKWVRGGAIETYK